MLRLALESLHFAASRRGHKRANANVIHICVIVWVWHMDYEYEGRRCCLTSPGIHLEGKIGNEYLCSGRESNNLGAVTRALRLLNQVESLFLALLTAANLLTCQGMPPLLHQ